MTKPGTREHFVQSALSAFHKHLLIPESYKTRNPLHCHYGNAEDVLSYAVPPRLFRALMTTNRNLSFDCNVSQRTGLGSLGVGFQMFPAKALSAHGASLCYVPHSTLLVNVLFPIVFCKKYIPI